MNRLKALTRAVAMLALLLLPATVHAQVQPVPKLHVDPLYWINARFANTGPSYWQTSILHGIGIETDTLGVFSLQNAVAPPSWIPQSQIVTNTTGFAVAATRDSIPIIAKIRVEVDSTGMTTLSGQTCDSIKVVISQVLWAPALTGNVTAPVTVASWKVIGCATVNVTGIATDNTTGMIEVPIPAYPWFGPTNAGASSIINAGSNVYRATSTGTMQPFFGGRFIATVQFFGGTFPAARASLLYYALE